MGWLAGHHINDGSLCRWASLRSACCLQLPSPPLFLCLEPFSHSFSTCRPSPPPTDGICYLFVSNSDNLGATLDLDLLAHFAHSDAGFMMEVRGGAGALDCRGVQQRQQPSLCSEREVRCSGSRGPAPVSAQVCERQASDKKGGHLARRKKDGRLM